MQKALNLGSSNRARKYTLIVGVSAIILSKYDFFHWMMLKYAKQQAKCEGQLDFYPTGTRQDVHLNRALTHWLSVGSLPYNVVDGGAFLNFCFEMNPRYRVPSRPYLQKHFLQRGYEAACKMLAVYLLYLNSAVWLSSDAWKSRYGKFSLISDCTFSGRRMELQSGACRSLILKQKMRVSTSLIHSCDDMFVAAVHKIYLPYLQCC